MPVRSTCLPATVRAMSAPIDPHQLPRPVFGNLAAEREATITRLSAGRALSAPQASAPR